MHTPTVLTIAGFDPYGGAGIQIDTKTIHALGGYALSSVTAMTAQNSKGVRAVEPVSANMLRLQLTTLLDDMKVDAVKIGMLANRDSIETVVEIIKRYALNNIVLDPVLVSSSGKTLLEPTAIRVMIEKLFPLVDLLTPNIPEVNRLLEIDHYRGEEAEVREIARKLFALHLKTVLLKGGHRCDNEAIDFLVYNSGEYVIFNGKKVETTHTHGTGCLLSSAIAAGLAKGEGEKESVFNAKQFLSRQLRKASALQLRYSAEDSCRREPLF